MKSIAATFAPICAFLLFASPARAQENDPEEAFWVTEGTCEGCPEDGYFTWQFTADFGQFLHYLAEGTARAYNQFGQTYAQAPDGRGNFNPFVGAGAWELDYGDRGFVTDEIDGFADDRGQQPMHYVRRVYVPESGGDWVRFLDTWTNDSDEEVTININYSGSLFLTDRFGGGGGDVWNVINTSDEDDRVEAGDNWAVCDDDEDGDGIPTVAIVWQSTGADERSDTVTISEDAFGGGSSFIQFRNVDIPAGESKTLALFAIQANTQEDAEFQAIELSEMLGAGSDFLDDVEDTIVNFIPGAPGAPRLRSNGPYRINEGGAIALNVEVFDPDDDPVTWSWDLDGDGSFGDFPNDPAPMIDGANVDGPSVIRVGIQISDGTHVVDRAVSVGVANVAPVVVSTPPVTAETNQLLQYQIEATDFPADVISYELEQGPTGMTVSRGGLLRWTPEANGQGPLVPAVILVTDDDGGELEHVLSLSMQGGPVVVPGGPYTVAEGGTVDLAPIVTDPEGDELIFAWDLNGDRIYEDSNEPSVTWSAAGIDGPSEGYVVSLVVTDGQYDITAQIPVSVNNAPPQFASEPSSTATIARLWTYSPNIVDPGADTFTIEVDEDEMPIGMTYDPIANLISWTPNAGALVLGEPPGNYSFTITAEDDDNGRGRQEVSLIVGQNSAPPLPPIKYPKDSDEVHSVQPTIILENVDDPDGDELQYFIEVDYDLCFCSATDHQLSPALPEGELVTQWQVARPLNVDLANGGHDRFYVRRWAFDGLSESAKELGVFTYTPGAPDGGDGDADADADADGDVDGDGDADIADEDGGDDGGKCACRTVGAPGGLHGGLAFALFAGAVLFRRRRRS